MTDVFRDTIGAGRQWLVGQSLAASARTRTVPIAIQYCMTFPSQVLASVEAPMVTNGRASGDYASVFNWDIGAGSMLWDAVQLRPSKDNFWTGRYNRDNPGGPTEPLQPADLGQRPFGDSYCKGAVEFNAAVALLSMGPVGISDGAGFTNETIVRCTCNGRGDLLQPNAPAISIDRTFAAEWECGRWSENGGTSSGAATAGRDGSSRCARVSTAEAGVEVGVIKGTQHNAMQ